MLLPGLWDRRTVAARGPRNSLASHAVARTRRPGTGAHRGTAGPARGPGPGARCAGPGRAVTALVRGGSAGVILDGRGRDFDWPAAELQRRDLVRSWLEALGALPTGVVS